MKSIFSEDNKYNGRHAKTLAVRNDRKPDVTKEFLKA